MAPTLRNLIDLAIGSPDPGHVNFIALHCVLTAFAERLLIADEPLQGHRLNSTYTLLKKNCSDAYKSHFFNRKKGGADTPPDVEDFQIPAGVTEPVPDEAQTDIIENTEAAPTEQADDQTEIKLTTEAELPTEREQPAEGEQSAEKEQPTEEQQAEVKQPAEGEQPVEGEKPVEDEKPIEGEKPVEGEKPAEEEQPTEGETAAEPEETAEPTDVTTPLDTIDSREGSERISIISEDREPSQETPPSDDDDISIHSTNTLDMGSLSEDHYGELTKSPSMIYGVDHPYPLVDYGFLKLESTILAMRNETEIIADLIKLLFTLGVKRVRTPNLVKEFNIVYQKLRNALKETALMSRGSHYSVMGDGYYIQEQRYEDDEYASSFMVSRGSEETESEDFDLYSTLPMSSEKFAEEWLKVKSAICSVTNKINTLTAMFLRYEKERSEIAIKELQAEMVEVKARINELKVEQGEMNIKIEQNYKDIRVVEVEVQILHDKKVDKDEFVILMAEKVNYEQLKRKVSTDTLMEIRCCIEKRLNELSNIITSKELNIMHRIDQMQEDFGLRAVEQILEDFKKHVNTQIQDVKNTIQEFLDSTNEDCAAAGGRFKMLQNMACISCDTPCVMRRIEHKVPKLQEMHAKTTIAPLITYELDNLRKTQAVQPHYKECSTSAAWILKETKPAVTECIRRAGGPHTITTVKETIEKVLKAPKIDQLH